MEAEREDVLVGLLAEMVTTLREISAHLKPVGRVAQLDLEENWGEDEYVEPLAYAGEPVASSGGISFDVR